MFKAMLATAGVDLIMATGWVGGVTLMLLGRALVSWWRFRNNSNFAIQARRLSEATRLSPRVQEGDTESGEVIPMPRPPKVAAGP
jgi:hypothetical protein